MRVFSQCRRRQPQRRSRAYSYVELVMVVQVIAILAAVAVPKFVNALNFHRADTAARRIVVALQSLRSAARMTATAKSISFDLDHHAYTLVGIANPDHPSLPNTVNLSGGLAPTRLSEVDLGGDTTLVYNGFGYPDSGGTIVVRAGSSVRTVIVDADMGTANIP